jgi:hypothetical protein
MNKLFAIAMMVATVGMFGCAQGEKGDSVQGLTGATGEQGPQGLTGPTGADGHIATIVQLCPGTPSYASVFVEVAMCINDQLYGVYSANGGFLTLLPPGTYNSNAIGSACTLTVSAHCIVSN